MVLQRLLHFVRCEARGQLLSEEGMGHETQGFDMSYKHAYVCLFLICINILRDNLAE